MVEYSGSRDLETLSKFLDNGGTLPEETEEEEKEEKEEEEEEEERKEEEVRIPYLEWYSIQFHI